MPCQTPPNANPMPTPYPLKNIVMKTMPSNQKHCRYHLTSYLLIVFALLLNGCGEFAYKRGANASDLDLAKKDCKMQNSDSAGIEKCMAGKGWVVQNLNKLEPIDADPVIEASAIPSDRRIENEPGAITAAGQKTEGAYVSANLPAPKQVAKKTPNMLDTFKVSSWWKVGSGANELKTDTEDCVTKLGEAHRPDVQTLSATRGFLLCMKDKGWSGLRTK